MVKAEKIEVEEMERPKMPFKVERKVVNGKFVVVPAYKDMTPAQKEQLKQYGKELRAYKKAQRAPGMARAQRIGYNKGFKAGKKAAMADVSKIRDEIKAAKNVAKNAAKIAKTEARLQKLKTGQ